MLCEVILEVESKQNVDRSKICGCMHSSKFKLISYVSTVTMGIQTKMYLAGINGTRKIQTICFYKTQKPYDKCTE